jgi:hypothetical protein
VVCAFCLQHTHKYSDHTIIVVAALYLLVLLGIIYLLVAKTLEALLILVVVFITGTVGRGAILWARTTRSTVKTMRARFEIVRVRKTVTRFYFARWCIGSDTTGTGTGTDTLIIEISELFQVVQNGLLPRITNVRI